MGYNYLEQLAKEGDPVKSTNCLAGMRCPGCGQDSHFKIRGYSHNLQGYVTATMCDDGTEETDLGDFEHDDTATCACGNVGCAWTGTVGETKEPEGPLTDAQLEAISEERLKRYTLKEVFERFEPIEQLERFKYRAGLRYAMPPYVCQNVPSTGSSGYMGEPIAIVGGPDCEESVRYVVGRSADYGQHGAEMTKVHAVLFMMSPRLMDFVITLSTLGVSAEPAEGDTERLRDVVTRADALVQEARKHCEQLT